MNTPQLIDIDRSELRKALDNFKFERMPDGGLYFPASRSRLGGYFVARKNGGESSIESNMVVNTGLDDILNVYFGAQAKRVNFYIAPFSLNVAVTSALNGASFTGTQGENTAYDESARVAWMHPTSATGQEISNSASPARFTFNATQNVWGAGILTTQPKGNTAGLLLAAANFAAVRPMIATDKLDLEYIFGAIDAS